MTAAEEIRKLTQELKEHNEVKMGAAYIVRVPKIDGKIFFFY